MGLLLAVSVHGQNLNYARYLLDTLCSPHFSGRGYVDNGLQKAADFIAFQMDSLGVEPLNGSRFQPFQHPVNIFRTPVSVQIDGLALTPGRDFHIHPSSPSYSGHLSVVQLDTTYIDRPGDIIITSEAVYVLHPVSPHNRDGASKRAGILRELAAWVPVIDPVDKLTWSVGTSVFKQPVIEVNRELVDWQNAETVVLSVESTFEEDFTSQNVLGVVRGTGATDSLLVITAHYDHLGMMGDVLFPGANDNASGTAMLLDLARHYSQNPPEYTVLFIAFAGEEAGLEGSRYFVDNPLVPLEKIRFLMNLDLVGTGEDGITVVNGKTFPEAARQLAQINQEHNLVPKIKVRGEAANSDHYWFSKNGVPAFFIYTMGDRAAYHDMYDVPDTIGFDGYEGLFRLVVEFLEPE